MLDCKLKVVEILHYLYTNSFSAKATCTTLALNKSGIPPKNRSQETRKQIFLKADMHRSQTLLTEKLVTKNKSEQIYTRK